jgi:MFS family permease
VRRTFALVCTIIFVDALLYGVITPLVPAYVADYHLSTFRAGLIVGSFGAGVFVGALPTGLLAGRVGGKTAVVVGLLLLAASSFAFAVAGSPLTISIARFVQGFSSTTTWAGALSWLTVASSRDKRGQLLGTVFGFAVLGAILGPTVGATADVIGIRSSFLAVSVTALVLAVVAATGPKVTPERGLPGALRRALADRGFALGMWLNALPAFFAGTLYLLAPLALAGQGYGTFAIGAVFLATGVLEAGLNPFIGRLADSRGTLLPIRISLVAGIVTCVLLAASPASFVAIFVVLTMLAIGSLYTPGIALVSDRAERSGLPQGLAFGVMNVAWAIGQVAGAPVAGALAGIRGDAPAYLLSAGLCALTLVAISQRASLASRRA